jgi:hypothetical protein
MQCSMHQSCNRFSPCGRFIQVCAPRLSMCALYHDPKQLKLSLYEQCCKTSGDAAWGTYWSAVVAMLRGELAKGIARVACLLYISNICIGKPDVSAHFLWSWWFMLDSFYVCICSHVCLHTVELDRIVVACLGAQGVPLHNQFICCLWQNAQCNRVPSSLETVAQQQP